MSHSINTTVAEQQNDMYFGSEVINRVSFLRGDLDFITNAAIHPSARFIAFYKTDPLINKLAANKLAIFVNGDEQLKDSQGLWNLSLWRNTIQQWCQDNKEQSKTTRSGEKPVVLFMGLEDESVGLNLLQLKAGEKDDTTTEQQERFLDHQGRYQGIPYFAIDLTNASKELIEFFKENVVEGNPSKEDVFFTRSRKHYLGFTNKEAALYSHGKMFMDWLSRNHFCPGCGTLVVPIHAGGKLKCTNEKTIQKKTVAKEGEEQEIEIEIPACPVKQTSVSNVSFPRTDAVIITAITNTDRTKVLLSLSKRHAATRMYACTAGFMEPSETVEVATKREIWEETGVVCSKINIVMTQPWPFPGNLMIGCLGVVDFNGINENIHLGHDRELADARWFDTETIRKWIYDSPKVDNPEEILLPNPESIAFLLIKMAVDQRQQKL